MGGTAKSIDAFLNDSVSRAAEAAQIAYPNLILSLTDRTYRIHSIVLLTAWALRLSADSALYSCSEILAGPGEGKAAKRRSALERVEGVSKLLGSWTRPSCRKSLSLDLSDKAGP